MELRSWITDTFGSKDSLLDESVYSEQEIREDKIRLKQQRKRLNKEMSQLQREYRELLEKGARASDVDRRQYAQQAKIKKKKYQVKQQKYQKNSIQMATIVTIEGARELMEMSGEDDLNLPDMTDVDYGSVQEHLMNEMVEYEIETDLMLEVQEALDIDIIGADVDMGGGEEQEIMEDIAAGDIETEEIDLDAQTDSDELDAEASIEDELGEEGLGVGPESL